MSSSQSLKQPPILENDDSYPEWKNDIDIWLLFTDLDKKKQGPAVYLTLAGRARECIRDLTPAEIGSDEGVKKIVEKLDTIFLKDVNTRSYLAFKDFYDYKRPPGIGMTEFLVRFEYLYHKLSVFDIKLPEGVQAFFLLNAANVSEENERLARATCGVMTYANMKSCILKIFGDPSASGEGSNTPAVKSEPVLYAQHDTSYSNRGRGWRGRSRSRSGRFRGYGRGQFANSGDTNSNPTDKDGKMMKCFKCGSTTHFSRWHERYDNDKHGDNTSTQEVHITLFNCEKSENLSILVGESLGKAILDSGCSKTVTGRQWLEIYIDGLCENDKKLVKTETSCERFKFGDGVQVVSDKKVTIPAIIDNLKVKIETHVVENEIPLLLSKSSMKKAGVVLDFNKDFVTILGKKIKLSVTTTGHYCVPLTNYVVNENGYAGVPIVLHATALKEMLPEEKKSKARKLHKQFSHASKEKLCKLVKQSSDYNDREFLKMIEEVCDNCEICLKFKRPSLRPIVTVPIASKFNEVVCMDLKEHMHNQSWILHLIDAATRYSAACLVFSKKADEIISSIFSIWIAYFGCPKKFLSDCGGEFSNESFREMNEKLNIENATTAGESPFSNGICERHNAILAECMKKTMLDANCDAKMALAWACSSKNSLQNHGGFSPNQLIFGQNPNYPSVLSDRLPALDSDSPNEVIFRNLQAMKKARENYIQAESSEKIRRSLKAKVRTYSDIEYKNGDKVYYRRKNFKGWKGPGVVLGQDGQLVLIRHGGAYYRCHPCHMTKFKQETQKEKSHQGDVSDPNTKTSETNKVVSNEVESDSDENDKPDNDMNNFEGFNADNDINNFHGFSDQRNLQNNQTNFLKPERNAYVKFKLVDSDDWKNAKILSIQPRQTRKHSNHMNVKITGDDEPTCVDWKTVDVWEELPEPEYPILLNQSEELSQDIVDAKYREIDNLTENKVYESVIYANQPTISSRWIITEKFREGVKKVKARLVARGFEEDSSKLIKDSPTCSRESLKLVFLTASLKRWNVQSIDITAAFLQGDEIEREIYLRPPRDVCSKDVVWKLKRCIYGLNDAPRSWYNKVCDVLLELGATKSSYDNALFLWHNDEGDLIGILTSHVDDFAFCGNVDFQTGVIEKIKEKFKIKEHHNGSFKYLGLNVTQNQMGIVIDQCLYISTVDQIVIAPDRQSKKDEELNLEERKELKRLSGQMLWVTSQTRPDVSFETCQMSNTGKNPTVKMILEANKAVIKLKSKKVCLRFPNLGDPDKLEVLVYADATYASLKDGCSQGGFIVFVKGIDNLVIPICWSSKKLNRVTKSPLASETLALCEGADAGFLVSTMLQEIFQLSKLPKVICFTDNKSLNETLKTSTIVTDRRLRVDIARLREMIVEEEIKVNWIQGIDQIADSFTKFGVSTVRMLQVLKCSKV